METSLDSFPLPKVEDGEDLGEEVVPSEKTRACSGDQVCEFREMAGATGCLGRFPGSEMMGIIKKFMRSKND